MTETTDTDKSETKPEPPINMQVSVERKSDIERKVAVEIPWDDVKSRLDEAYHELQLGVTIKGFRRGKVPRKMLEQLFGKHVTKEVAQRMVQESIGKALEKEGLAPVSEPQVVDGGIVEGESFHYSAEMQVVPEIEAKDYFGVDVTQRPPRVTDQDVESSLRIKQRELTAYKAIEGRNTQLGDVLLVDIIGKVGDQPVDAQGELVELTTPPREPLPGLAEKLTGIAPTTEELSLELEVPMHEHAPGEPCPDGEKKQRARLLVTIKDVKQRVVPEIDDDFARDTGEADTLSKLRDVLRGKLLTQDEMRAKDEAKQSLVKEIVKRNVVPQIPALVERQLDQAVKLQLAMLGLEPNSRQIDEEALKERMRPDAAETVKAALLLEAIAKKETVEVTDADVEKKLAEIAAARSQNLARVRSEYEKEGHLAALRARIREDKTLDLLMSKANIVLKPPTEPDATATPPGAEAQSPQGNE
jgi:trigger factor